MAYTFTETDLDRIEAKFRAFMDSHPGFDPNPEEDVFDGSWDEQMACIDYDILVEHGRIIP